MQYTDCDVDELIGQNINDGDDELVLQNINGMMKNSEIIASTVWAAAARADE